MTARQFGAWHARVIGPQAIITGPRGTQITANAASLRNMNGSSRLGEQQRAAYAWAIKQLEGSE